MKDPEYNVSINVIFDGDTYRLEFITPNQSPEEREREFRQCWDRANWANIERYVSKQSVSPKALWYGNTVCFTGKMVDREGNKITRDKAQNEANQYGFICLPDVLKGCTFLVAAAPSKKTNKLQSAQIYKIPILSPKQFWQMIDETTGAE